MYIKQLHHIEKIKQFHFYKNAIGNEQYIHKTCIVLLVALLRHIGQHCGLYTCASKLGRLYCCPPEAFDLDSEPGDSKTIDRNDIFKGNNQFLLILDHQINM